jgi:hypothetical protein
MSYYTMLALWMKIVMGPHKVPNGGTRLGEQEK